MANSAFSAAEAASDKPKLIVLDSPPKQAKQENAALLAKPAEQLSAKADATTTPAAKEEAPKALLLNQLSTASGPASTQSIKPSIDNGDASKFQCNQKLLHGFGLNGLPEASVEAHKHCPNVHRNCCAAADEDLSMDYWKTRDHVNVDRYYRAHSLMINYLLGYAKEGVDLAKKFKATPGKCQEAAIVFEDLNTSRVLIEKILETFKISIKAMATFRTGFYCNICDHTSNSFFHPTNPELTAGNIQISKQTCEVIVRDTIPASYHAVTYLKKLLESLGVLIACESGETENLTFDVDHDEIRKVTQCFEGKDKFSITACESYCGAVKISHPVPMIDGYVDQLYKFFLRFKNNKRSVFKHPELNVFVVSPDFEESAIVSDMGELQIKREFFKNMGIGDVKLENFQTTVNEIGGANLWDNMVGRSYYSYMAGAAILKALAALLATFWVM